MQPSFHDPARAWLHKARSWDWETIALMLGVKGLLVFLGVQTFTAAAKHYSGALEIWSRWDAIHYLHLAQHGYGGGADERVLLAFFPLYPWLVRIATLGSGAYVGAAFFVSGLASIAAALLLRRLVELDHTPETARTAVWFFAIFPTAYFLHIAYTESLFLALTLGCLLAARKERWAWAGCLGALASLTRLNGLLLLPVLALEAGLHWRAGRRFNPRWLWSVAVVAGFAVYLWLNYHVAGDPFAFSKIQSEHWYRKLTPPWVGLRDVWLRMPGGNSMEGLHEFLYIVFTFAGTIWCWVKLRPSYAVWMSCNWLLITSTKFVLSVPRYTLTLFPVFILLALVGAKHRTWFCLLSACSLVFLAMYAGRFVQGLWAF